MVEKKEFKVGDFIYKQTDDPDGVYFVQYGVVNLYGDYNTPKARLQSDVREGGAFGVLGLIERKRSQTAVAKTDCVLLHVSKDSIKDYLQENPSKMVSVMESLGNRIKEVSKNYAEAKNLIKDYVEQKKNGGKVDDFIIEGMKDLAALSAVRK